MSYALIRRVLAAASEFNRSLDRRAALCVLQAESQSDDDTARDAQHEAELVAADEDRILRTIIGRMRASSETLQTALSTEQDNDVTQAAVTLFRENISVLLSITRQLKGGKLPLAALREIEALHSQ